MMASIVLLLSELLCRESASVLAADRYMCGQSLREFRPATAVTTTTGAREEEEQANKEEEAFEDLAASRIAVVVDLMWP